MKRQNGFTLVEISIVLVIVGLILGGVLKGQSLIDSARVRSIVNDINGIRAAWYGFQDRFQALPGDYVDAAVNISTLSTSGNGSGSINSKQEVASVWRHLSLSGFIAGDYDGDSSNISALGDDTCAASTCPENPYYGFYKITYTKKADGASGETNELYTGGKIPSSVLFEIDTKLDDGLPKAGLFRVHSDSSALCTSNDRWKVENEHRDCAGVFIE
jgi:prepilin-type N-terminal cleavage/methylation domain-containing protein